MPIGSFLDSLPALLFVAAHVVFLGVGLWAVKNAASGYARAFWLYVASQVVFLSFFGGLFTMKMAVLLEQTLMVVMVVAIGRRK
jgi:uncharacterized membrane protein